MNREKYIAFITVFFVAASVWNLTRTKFIQEEYEQYKIKNDVIHFGREITRLAKTVNALEKQKIHNEVLAVRKRREESFARKGVTAPLPPALYGCKRTDPYDPMVREEYMINDQDLRHRKEVVQYVPHRICPRSLNPKVDAKEYLYWNDRANKKHLKFQATYKNKLSCDRHRSTAQFSQDIRLHRRFFRFMKELVFVEVGAFDGVVFSNSYFEEKCLGWKGLCIEPQRRFAGIIQKSRSCGVINAAIINSENDQEGEEIDIVVGGVLGGEDGTLSKGLKAKSLAKQYPEHENLVLGYKLASIFRVNDIKKVDHLAVDCEGCEMNVLQSIDYAAVQIRLIQIETNGKDKEIKAFLEKYGYTWVEDMGEDAIFVANEEVGQYKKE